MRLILHIGLSKTASTFLQNWLYENRGNLSEQGTYLSKILQAQNIGIFPCTLEPNLIGCFSIFP